MWAEIQRKSEKDLSGSAQSNNRDLWHHQGIHNLLGKTDVIEICNHDLSYKRDQKRRDLG